MVPPQQQKHFWRPFFLFLIKLHFKAFYWTELCFACFQKPFFKHRKHESSNSGYSWVGSRMTDDVFLLYTVLYFPNFPQSLMYRFHNTRRKKIKDGAFKLFPSSPDKTFFSILPEFPTSWKHPGNRTAVLSTKYIAHPQPVPDMKQLKKHLLSGWWIWGNI